MVNRPFSDMVMVRDDIAGQVTEALIGWIQKTLMLAAPFAGLTFERPERSAR